MKSLLISIIFFILLFMITGCSNEQEFSNVEVTITPDNIKKGKSLYMVNCASCHGTEGKGDGLAAQYLNPKPRNHTDKSIMDKISNGRIFDVIKKGGVIVGSPMMPATPQLKDDEIKSLIAFIRSIEK